MENFIVSARKYRPSTFNSVVGQPSLTTTLKNAIRNNQLGHAYLFCGPRGVGKTTCARIFAKTINCLKLTSEYEACNECESCVSFNQQRSYNISELDAASNNSVDDIRSLTDQVRIPPQIGKYSVYIIDEVHMLSTQAFNAFLKTLEEPPAHAIFILATTEKHKIIPTILSRCQIFDFNRITVADTVKHLQSIALKEGVSVDVDGLNIVAQKSDGGMRDALSIFDQLVSFCGKEISYQGVIDNLNVLDYEYYFRLVDHFVKGEVSQTLLIFNEILNKGFDAHHFITGLSSHLRDVLVSKDPQTIVLLEVGDGIGDRYKAQAQICTSDFIFKALKLANDCDIDYRLSKNKRLLVELTLIRLCQLTEEKKKSNVDSEKEVLQSIAVNQPTTNPPSTVLSTPQQGEARSTLMSQENPNPSNTPTLKRPISISISTPTPSSQPEHNSLAQDNRKKEEVTTEKFTVEQLISGLKRFAETIPEKGRMVSLLANTEPVLISETNFEITVSNSLQEKDMVLIQGDLLDFLRLELKNSQINLTVKVEKESEMEKSSTPESRYKLMVSQNPALAVLKSNLQLEID
jgi:DNA polymerase-3 subunit gamma/tau